MTARRVILALWGLAVPLAVWVLAAPPPSGNVDGRTALAVAIAGAAILTQHRAERHEDET